MPEPKTPLDRKIDEFQSLAREYHKKKSLNVTDPKKLTKHREELNSHLSYLEAQRRDIDVHAQIQEQLALYQSGNKAPENETQAAASTRVNQLSSEKYHPTDDLQRNLLAAGSPSPDENCTCHHIVPGHGRMLKNKVTGKLTRSRNSIAARNKLHLLGVGINDADNGVWLPAGMTYVPHWAMRKALPHSRIHTVRYEAHVRQKMDLASNEQQARQALNDVRSELESGKASHLLTDESELLYLAKTV